MKESAYNKARTAAEAGRDKLPNLQGQADEAARIAHASAMAAQEHAGGTLLNLVSITRNPRTLRLWPVPVLVCMRRSVCVQQQCSRLCACVSGTGTAL